MTTSRIRVLPYKQGSKSSKALADALGGRVLKLTGSTFTPRHTDLVICWGKADAHPALARFMNTNHLARVLNDPEDVVNASNKLEFFRTMPQDVVPPWWDNANDIPDDAFPVVCRTVLSGHSGEGIVIAATRDDLVTAPLYVKYVKKKHEYRVHCGQRDDTSIEVIAVQRKAKRQGVDNVNWQVRNLANGFVYVREGFTAPGAVLHAACVSFAETGLDFGAVDVIWNELEQRAYVLEINSAPGLCGTTITDYAKYFKELIQ